MSDEETAKLIEQANQPQYKIENQVYAALVKVDSNRVAVDFTNIGFLFDRVDYVETNLIVWHSEDYRDGFALNMVLAEQAVSYIIKLIHKISNL